MTDASGLRLNIADAARRYAGFLNCDAADAADVPFRFGDEFPFEDRAAEIIVAGAAFAALARHIQLYFLLECRRVIRPGGVVRLPWQPHNESLVRLAALAGLEPIESAAPNTGNPAAVGTPSCAFTKRDRTVAGDPLVSIVIPAYNARFFAACLDSALAQSYDNIEVVVRDDSADGAIEELVRARASRRKIRYTRNPVRLKVRRNYIAGFEDAAGEFVKFLCDDDVLARDCVERLLDTMRRAPDIVLATSHRRRIDERGSALPDQPATLPIVAADAVIAGYTLANAMLMAGLNIIGEPTTVLFRKADLADQRPALFNLDGAHGHGAIDMVMWAALLLKGDAVYLRQSLSDFRIHPGQRQHDPEKRQRNIDSIRGLQATWLAFKLFEKVSPHLLLAKAFPPAAGADWTLQQVLSFGTRNGDVPPANASAPSPVGGHWG